MELNLWGLNCCELCCTASFSFGFIAWRILKLSGTKTWYYAKMNVWYCGRRGYCSEYWLKILSWIVQLRFMEICKPFNSKEGRGCVEAWLNAPATMHVLQFSNKERLKNPKCEIILVSTMPPVVNVWLAVRFASSNAFSGYLGICNEWVRPWPLNGNRISMDIYVNRKNGRQVRRTSEYSANVSVPVRRIGHFLALCIQQQSSNWHQCIFSGWWEIIKAYAYLGPRNQKNARQYLSEIKPGSKWRRTAHTQRNPLIWWGNRDKGETAGPPVRAHVFGEVSNSNLIVITKYFWNFSTSSGEAAKGVAQLHHKAVAKTPL